MLALAVFLKYPTPGKVKTRIGLSLGMERAAEIYDKMVRIVLDQLAELPPTWKCYAFIDPLEPLTKYQKWLGSSGLELRCQHGADLGERLAACFESLLAEHTRVLAIGTDCLDITPNLMAQANVALDAADIVLGPTTDGGYYLIGMKSLSPWMFGSIAWSTEKVYSQSVLVASVHQQTVASLEILVDIDTEREVRNEPRLAKFITRLP